MTRLAVSTALSEGDVPKAVETADRSLIMRGTALKRGVTETPLHPSQRM
jgi:hypothetical protein